MQLKLTREQFRKLLDLVYVGNWVINVHRPESEVLEEYNRLESDIFSYCADEGMVYLVDYDYDLDEYYPSHRYEDEIIDKYIRAYDENIFWSELIDRLSDKELFRSLESGDTLSAEDILRKRIEIEERFANEFKKNGLKNVEVKMV